MQHEFYMVTRRQDILEPPAPDLIPDKDERIEKPKRYFVRMLNDDYTDMAFVVQTVMGVFGTSHGEATSIMLEIHKKGSAAVGDFFYDVAESKAAKVCEQAKKAQYPFLAFAEKAPDAP